MPNHHTCAVAVCKNRGGDNISYYSFPKDPQIRAKWVHSCKRADKFNAANTNICSVHFRPIDYERDLRNELLQITPRKKLKKEAVPTIKLGKEGTEHCAHNLFAGDAMTEQVTASPRAERCVRRNIRKSALVRIRSISPLKHQLDQATNTDFDTINDSCTKSMLEKIKHLKRKIKLLENNAKRANKRRCCDRAKLAKQDTVIRQLLAESRKPCTSTAICAKKLHRDGSLLPVKCRKWLADHTENEQLHHMATMDLCKTLARKKEAKLIHWTAEDIASALSVRSVSRRAYSHLRNIGYPFPSLTTLRTWTKSFGCRPGILWEVLTLIEKKTSGFKVQERLCILSFDDMNVDARICYNQAMDKILGPHSNVQIVMVRGLVKNWKQPIYYDFDATMTPDLLREIVKAVEAIGLMVVGVVNDMGGKNQKLWNDMNVNMTKTFFNNPAVETRKIWVFHDVPHLLKLLRNYFIDSGFKLSNGSIVTKDMIRKLLNQGFHISEHHINVTGQARQHVRTAAELFSDQTAKALRILDNSAFDAAKLFEVVNDGFNIMNNHIPIDEAKRQYAFGLKFGQQNKQLEYLKQAVYQLRVGTRKILLPFQKGFVISIESLRGLFCDMQAYDIKYILTARLNLDCLENFFSRIRFVGTAYDHPLPSDVYSRIRILILTSNTDELCISRSSSVAEQHNATTSLAESTSSSESLTSIVVANVEEDDLTSFITNDLFINVVNNSTDKLIQHDEFENDGNYIVLEPDESATVLYNEIIASSVDCSNEALRYLAGYIAFCCSDVDSTLGTPTGQLPIADQNMGDWIQFLSKGGLRAPSDAWMDIISQFEVNFAGFHRSKLATCDGVMSTLCSILEAKFSNIHPKIIKMYVRTRTFIRMQHLNKCLRENHLRKAAERKNRKFANSAK